MTAAQRYREFPRAAAVRLRRTYHAARRRPWGSSQDHPRLDPDGEPIPEFSTDVGGLLAAHDGRLVHKWVHYLPAYSKEFARFRDGVPTPDGSTRPLKFLEIGVSHGGSLELWRQYFGPRAIIVGIDVDERCASFDGEAGRVRIGSQDDPAFLRSVVAEMGGVDIVLDDGSHVARHQRTSFDTLYPLLAEGGIYAAEDLHTAYWARFGGGRRRRGTFVDLLNRLVDDMHEPYHRRGTSALPAGCGLTSISLYDSLVFLHKGPPREPATITLGRPSF
jgi:hypothetical protein